MEEIRNSYNGSDSESDQASVGSEEQQMPQLNNETVDSEEKSFDNNAVESKTTPTTTTATTATTPPLKKQSSSKRHGVNTFESLKYSCAFVPMRLTPSERLQLLVLENALEVCEYTDVVDVTYSHTRKNKYTRILESLIDILSISCGLITSNSLQKGDALLEKSLNENVPLFRDLFEIGRRFKIMNPSKMRNTYGKLMYILMDAESGLVKNELKINFVKPILTIEAFLRERQAQNMIDDPLLFQASVLNSENTSKEEREASLKLLVARYHSDLLKEDDIIRVLDSLADNEAFKAFNVAPVQRMLDILHQNFDPNKAPQNELFSLELNGRNGNKNRNAMISSFSYGFSSRYFGGGAMLNHDHKTQYTFVKQSLMLWREVMHWMPKLWLLADNDMLNEPYRLADTGQGYQRLQQCPNVGREMRRILSHVQSNSSPWVGLSVVHLGDRDVPNALIFIDKYTQVPRILTPIVQCIEKLPSLVNDTAFHQYVNAEWNSISALRLQILSDFFKHGFDGSGDDGGSCIDGRLTSAWNWCSKLHKKPYYHVFMFTGFQGFDGDWKED